MKHKTKILDGFLRKKEILQLLKISKSKWDRGIVKGVYPKGHKIGARTRVWSTESIANLIEDIKGGKHEK